MEQITAIGLNSAKSMFPVHDVDALGASVVRRRLKRRRALSLFANLAPHHSMGPGNCLFASVRC